MPLCRLWLQVEYPADGSRTDVLLPENITLLDYYGEPAQGHDRSAQRVYGKPLPLPQGCICWQTEISRCSLSTLPGW